MSRNRIFMKYAVAVMLLFQLHTLAQSDKSFSLSESEDHSNDIVMTWNKNTPESEMKDDIKALSEKGITIKYSGVKRNANNEITAIRVEYSDRKGNKGNLEYNNQKPITTIVFYKEGDEIGFGESNSTNNGFASNDFTNGFTNPQDLMKQFQFNNGGGDSRSFSFSFPNDGDGGMKSSKSRIMIQRDDRKPLVIEDGKIIEGGDDYTPEELEKIKNENKVDSFGFNNNGQKQFDFRNQDGLDQYKKQMEQMQLELNKMAPNLKGADDTQSEMEQAKQEMLKAKEEMIKAREELEKTKKDLEKSKPKLKTQKT